MILRLQNLNRVKTLVFASSVICTMLFVSSCLTGKKVAKHNKKYMDRTYTAMKEGLPNAIVTMLNDTVKVVFNNALLFDFNKADIDPKIYPSIEHFAQLLNKYEKAEILIVGHTDSIGGDNRNNRELSTRRAENVGSLLEHYKVAAHRIDKWGVGASQPVASNTTEEGRAQNRRVEFILLYDYDKLKEKH